MPHIHADDLGAPVRSQVDVSDKPCVAAADVGGTNLRVVLANKGGQILGRWSATTVGIREPELVVDLIRTGVLSLLEEHGLPLQALHSVAAGAPGVTDSDAGVVIATSYLLGWRDVPLRAMLENALGVPAAVDNDVNLGALGENWLGAAKGVRNFVFVALGTGVGAGVMLNGQLLRGSQWRAGEVGYMLVPGTSTEPIGSGEAGALERYIGGEGIKAQWRDMWDAGSVLLPRDLSASEIFAEAVLGSIPAQQVLQQTAQLLAMAIHNISVVINTPVFVLGGGVGINPTLCEATRAHLHRLRPGATIELHLSTLGVDAQLIGALRLALDLAAMNSAP